MDQIRSNPLGCVFFGRKGKRNISVHRKVVGPDLKKITLFETIRATASVTVRKYDEKGSLIEESSSSEIPPEPTEPKPAEINWFFSECPDENVLEVSKKLLGIVKEFVEDAKSRLTSFPQNSACGSRGPA